MTFNELMMKFKAEEGADCISPLLDSAPLRNAVVAWKSVKIKKKCSDSDNCDLISEVEQWEWLWNNVTFDPHEFGVVAGLREFEVMTILTRLKGFRLIYPDGTINKLASQFINGLIMAKLKVKAKGNAPQTPQ